MADTKDDQPMTTRRTVLAGVGVVGVVGTLAACGSGGSTDNGSSTTGGGNNAGGGGAGSAVKTSDIPVGGGKIFNAVVITQPAAGTFKAFSSTCTHQGCQVSSVSDGLITCPCHHSQFSIEDGSVKGGPAPAPLPSKTVTVKNGEITVA